MDICPICFERIKNPYFCNPCRHIFCYSCISAWRNGTCPLCREQIKSYNRAQQVSPTAAESTADAPNYAERSKMYVFILIVVFILVDIPSSAGFLRSVVYPPCRDLILIIWEILYIVLITILMPVKSIYRLIVEIVIFELYDILLAICYVPLGIGRILINFPFNFYEGLKVYFFDNSWSSLLHRTVHLLLVVLLIDSAEQTLWLRAFERIQLKARFYREYNKVLERIERIRGNS
ncbi:E3 ubiquitin-protein ligase rnf213-alpha-like [Saccostrea echinata]|uniref:E3 ubiquitin-protein ligase rnf213-alpha-like n=1 Tax=Saccostrea echinata TaxID=191078 RepID=UPI002A8079AC|nr:E3 ubiquitin-protein ligase rnf213-alpha-like [Saccostrea echinata]